MELSFVSVGRDSGRSVLSIPDDSFLDFYVQSLYKFLKIYIQL